MMDEKDQKNKRKLHYKSINLNDMFDKLENEDAVYKPQESLKKMHSAEINPSQKMLIKLPY